MAKKATAKPVENIGKARLELRLDKEVNDGIKQLADTAGISVNQLMQALARWAWQEGQVGEPKRDADGIVRAKDQTGCIWIGRTGYKLSEVAEDEMPPDVRERIRDEQNGIVKGEIKLILDFTERRVLRDE